MLLEIEWWSYSSRPQCTTRIIIIVWRSWWRHQMETFSALLAICAGNSPVTGEFPAQRPVTRSFDVFFDLRLNKRLSKQRWSWWFETPSRPLWRRSVMWPRHQVTNGVDFLTLRELTFKWDYHTSRVMVLVNLSATIDTDRGVSRVPRGNDVTFLLKWGAWHSQKKLVSFHRKYSCGILCLIFPCFFLYTSNVTNHLLHHCDVHRIFPRNLSAVWIIYHQAFNIRRTKSQNINVSSLLMQLS